MRGEYTNSLIDVPKPNKRQEFQIHMCKATDHCWTVINALGWPLIILFFIMAFPRVMITQRIEESRTLLPETQSILIIIIILAWLGLLFGGMLAKMISGTHMELDVKKILITTDQNILYRMDVNNLYRSELDNKVHFTYIGYIIHYLKMKKDDELNTRMLEDFEKNRKKVENIIDETLNPKRKDDIYSDSRIFIKLNSPKIVKKLTGTYIKYWDEPYSKWVTIPFPKATENYDMIYQMIQSRNS